MNWEIFILLIFVFVSFIYVYNRKNNLDLIDIFIFTNTLFLGLYPIADILNYKYNVESIVFFNTISYIFINLFLLRVCFDLFTPLKFRVQIKFVYLIQLASKLSQSFLNIIFIISLSIIFYFFVQYNFIFRVINTDIVLVNMYYQVILTVVFPLFTIITISSTAKINLIDKNTINKYLNYFFIIFISFYWLFYGRREFMFHLIIIGVVWFLSKKSKFSFKELLYIGFGIFLIIIGSNIYQNLRNDILFYSKNQEVNISKNILEMAFDFKSSENNLKERSSALPQLSMIIDKIGGSREPSNGKIFFTSIKNSIPKIFNNNKKYINDDDIIAEQLGIIPKDFNTNLYSSFYVDFGYLSLLILPLFLFVFLYITSSILFFLKQSQIIFILIFITALTVLLNIEISVTNMFIAIRQIFLLAFIYIILRKWFKYFFKINL